MGSRGSAGSPASRATRVSFARRRHHEPHTRSAPAVLPRPARGLGRAHDADHQYVRARSSGLGAGHTRAAGAPKELGIWNLEFGILTHSYFLIPNSKFVSRRTVTFLPRILVARSAAMISSARE